MYNTTNNIDTKPLNDLVNSIYNIKYTIGNLTNTIKNISASVSKYNPNKIKVPYNFIIIGFIVYTITCLLCYNGNYICKKISNKIYPVIQDSIEDDIEDSN